MTTLTILIPTQGRAELERCLHSCIDAGLRQDDEILVIDDAHEGAHMYRFWRSRREVLV